jgi:hypothetical protein
MPRQPQTATGGRDDDEDGWREGLPTVAPVDRFRAVVKHSSLGDHYLT